MCPDFCALIKLSIKDRLPIPIIDDLLDELQGACVFTELYLCFDYHQIWMKEVNFPKTTFINHQGHYEFLFMPFGHCNSLSTFQSLMNKLLKP
jgi:hypothetical protein